MYIPNVIALLECHLGIDRPDAMPEKENADGLDGAWQPSMHGNHFGHTRYICGMCLVTAGYSHEGGSIQDAQAQWMLAIFLTTWRWLR